MILHVLQSTADIKAHVLDVMRSSTFNHFFQRNCISRSNFTDIILMRNDFKCKFFQYRNMLVVCGVMTSFPMVPIDYEFTWYCLYSWHELSCYNALAELNGVMLEKCLVWLEIAFG